MIISSGLNIKLKYLTFNYFLSLSFSLYVETKKFFYFSLN